MESLNNEPIIIDDDDDDFPVSKNSTRAELKKDNIFTILSDRKETNDDLLDIEEIPKTIHGKLVFAFAFLLSFHSISISQKVFLFFF